MHAELNLKDKEFKKTGQFFKNVTDEKEELLMKVISIILFKFIIYF